MFMTAMIDHLLLFGLLLFCANRTFVYEPLVFFLASLCRAAEAAEWMKGVMGQYQNWAQGSYHIVSFSWFTEDSLTMYQLYYACFVGS